MNHRMMSKPRRQLPALAVLAFLFTLPSAVVAEVQGRFLELPSQISDRQVSVLRSQMLKLAQNTDGQQEPPVMVVRIQPGTSTTGNVTDLARVLIDPDTAAVRTVAWVPETLTGSHAIIALACHEIIMAPDAGLGDIGRGRAVASDEAEFARRVVAKRRNSGLPAAVAEAMLDPGAGLVRIGVSGDDDKTWYQFVSTAELNQRLQAGVEILETDRIRAPGQSTTITASEALRLRFLISQSAQDDNEVRRLLKLPPESRREPQMTESPVKVAVIGIRDVITPVVSDFVVREIHKVVREGANLLVLDIDSPGGVLISSEEIATAVAELDPKQVTSVAWIQHDAISGAAVAALGCDQIIMHPDARIGDIGVIVRGHDGAFDRVPEKQISPFLLTMEKLAKMKDRPVALLHAMVDRNLKVYQVTHRDTGERTWMTQFQIDDSHGEWIQGNIVPESREEILLTLNGQRAHELGIAEAPCNDEQELRLRLGIPSEKDLTPRGASWVDELVYWLRTGIGGFSLITLAILCIYMEAHLPSGLFGILSATLFALYFWSRYLGGTAGTLELVLFLLGTGLLLLEIFVVPGFGVFGISGILLMGGSLIMASQTFSGMTAGERFAETMNGLGTLAGAMVTVIIVASILNHFLPSMPVLKHLILSPPGQVADSAAAGSGTAVTLSGEPLGVGDRGTASSMLRPAGKASFGENYIDVVSDGAYIEHGTPVEIVRVAGNRVVVRAVEDA